MDLGARLKRLEKLDERASAETGCICFPPDEPPELQLKAEVESARSVLCPLHGERFVNVAPAIWRVIELPAHMNLSEWRWHSPQYIKAMKASFSPDRWPASEVTEPDGTVRFVLKDGVEIHRIDRPPEIYDYDTGKLIGRVAPRGRLESLAVIPWQELHH